MVDTNNDTQATDPMDIYLFTSPDQNPKLSLQDGKTILKHIEKNIRPKGICSIACFASSEKFNDSHRKLKLFNDQKQQNSRFSLFESISITSTTSSSESL